MCFGGGPGESGPRIKRGGPGGCGSAGGGPGGGQNFALFFSSPDPFFFVSVFPISDVFRGIAVVPACFHY